MDRISYKIATSDIESKEALELRKQVFVDEQCISEHLEIDGRDKEALHIVAKDGEKVIGTARVRFIAPGQAKIERIAIQKSFRGRGIGREIITFLTQELRNRQVKKVVLHAQYSAIPFYKLCNFEEVGLPFLEDGIKHIKMQKRL